MRNPVHPFAGNPLDRGENIRREDASVAALADHSSALFLPFHKLNVLLNADQTLAWRTRPALPEHNQLIFLGLQNNVPHFAVDVPDPADPKSFVDCRAVAAHLASADTGILAQARAQLDWHRRNPFCAQCGQPSTAERGGQIRRCLSCHKHIFPRTDPVAIMLIIDRPGGERCLLGQTQGFMANTNFYSALAGFIDQGESLEEAVRREVKEEACIAVGDVHYHSSQPWPFPSQLMIGCHGIARSHAITINEAEMADVRWFSSEQVILALGESPADLRVPGKLAIAHHLIRAWVDGEVRL